MMKVCHMTSAHGQEDVRIFHKECRSLAQAGYEVYFVSPGETYDKDGVHIAGVEKASGGRLARALYTARNVYLKALELDADVYHFHDPELLPYGLMLKRKGKAVIFDSHEHTAEQILEEKTWIPKPIRRIAYHSFCWYQKAVCKRIDYVITVTPHVYDYFHAFQPHTTIVTNYPIYRPLDHFPDYSSKTVGFAGGVSAFWSHHNIIAALEKIDGARYILCGPGEEQYLATLKALPGWSKVDFRGLIPHGEVSAAMAQCSVGVALSAYRGCVVKGQGTLGNTKIFEQMMAGLPVVCTDFLLWKQIIDEYQCGICIDPDSIDDIVSALTTLMNDPKMAETMGKNGHRAIKEKYNWDTQKDILLDVYNTMHNPPPQAYLLCLAALRPHRGRHIPGTAVSACAKGPVQEVVFVSLCPLLHSAVLIAAIWQLDHTDARCPL